AASTTPVGASARRSPATPPHEDTTMSNTRDDSLRAHLSALVDGELEPLAAIALTRHARPNPALEADRQGLQRLNLAVHLAGRQEAAPVGLETRLRAQVAGLADAREAARSRVGWLVPALALGATAALVVAVAVTSLGPAAPDASAPTASAADDGAA